MRPNQTIALRSKGLAIASCLADPKSVVLRALIWVGPLCVLMAADVALAQSGAQPTPGPKYRGASLFDEEARLKQCLKDWDANTHLTRPEWKRICRRVTSERVKYLREHGYIANDKQWRARAKQ